MNMNSGSEGAVTLITKNSEGVVPVNTVSSGEEAVILNTKDSVGVVPVNTDGAS